jgi:glycosyltransferase involved in cell wall biosynthesis
MLHSPYRKGADVVYKAMRRILHDRSNVHFIVKSVGMNKLHTLPRSMYVSGWLSEEDIIRLYDTADILLSPSRGGGYELNIQEALARGLIAVTSDWPAILEHAEPYALVTRNTGKKVKPLHNNPIHTGYGTDPDPEHFHEQIEYAIDNLDSLKKKGRGYAEKIRKKYNWIEIAKLIKEHLQGGNDG